MNSEISQYQNDFEEHTLRDYWLVLTRRWWVVAVVFVMVLSGGIVYAMSRPSPPFPHKTTIEIGQFADGGHLENIKTVMAKMRDAYIPNVLSEYASQIGYEEERYAIEVEISEDGVEGAFVLISYGAESDTKILLDLQQKVVDLLLRDHSRKIEFIKNDLEQQKLSIKSALEELKNRELSFPRKRQIIDDKAQLLKRQIESTSNFISSAEKDRVSAITSSVAKGTFDQSTTALLLIDNNISDNRDKLRALEERYYINLQSERDALGQEELDLKRAQKEQEQLFQNVDFRINNIQNTRALLSPSRLLRKSPNSPLSTIGIFGLVGVLFGFFAAGFVEFVSNAQQYGKTLRKS